MGASRSLSWAYRLAAVVCLGMLGSGFAVDHTITMNNTHAFSRPDITITAGDRVIWDSLTIITPHTVTCVPGRLPVGCFTASGTIQDSLFSNDFFVLPNTTNQTYFRTSGIYDYRCEFHAEMTGIVRVNPGPLHHYLVTAPAATTAGDSFNVTVTAQDQFNNNLNIARTVHIDSNDPNDTMPANITLSGGTGTFTGAILRTAGTRRITVNDTVSTTITGIRDVTVTPAAASQLVITAPANASATGAFQVVVTARDPFNNTAPSYTGTVHFTSSDPGAILPADSTLVSGTRNFNVALATTGPQVITATDTLNPAITGSANVTVAIDCSISFSNAAAINTPVIGLATLYPSNIVVGGLKQTVSGISVTLNGVTHTQPADFDVLLVSPGGQKMIIMADAGSIHDVSNISITFSDAGTALLPLTEILTSGTFKPTNHGGLDNFAPPAPAAPYFSPAPTGTATFGSVFNGTNPNGTWSLYVVDDLGSAGSFGGFTGGWSLTFAAPPNTYCNKTNIAIPTQGNATPYPSSIDVSGVDGTIKSATVRLNRLSQFSTGDLDLLLVGPGDRKMTILSDVNTTMASNAVVSFDDSGVAIPATLVSGAFQPRNVSQDADLFSSPAPPPPYSNPAPTGSATFASVFNGADPNGNWDLFVVDDTVTLIGLPGNIQEGWALTLDVIFNTSITLDANISPSVVGQLVTLTANVSSSGPIPTGTVTFKVGGEETATSPLQDGTAVLFTNFVAGSYNFTATYNGDTNSRPSTSNAILQVVNPGPSATAVASSANPTTFGQAVTFTATVSETTPYTPTGTVAFMDGDSILGTSNLNAGVASLATTAVGGGSRSITAVYNGDVNFAGSTSPVLTQQVNPAASSTTLVSSLNPSTFGSSVTFTATVSGGALGVPRGIVTFKDGTTIIGTSTVNESGVGSFSTSGLGVGAHNITAVYDGSDDFATSTSAVVSQTVDKATPTISVISFLNPSNLGEEITFRADVASSASTFPTGTVFFKDGLTLLGTVALDGSGTALFSTSALTAGTHNITVGYDGDANFKGNISSAVVQEVIGLESATTVTSDPSPSTFGQLILFTATVTSPFGAPTGGTVTFRNGEALLATVGVNGAGVAAVARQLQSGQHSITATYNGDTTFGSSTSAPITQTVNTSTATFQGIFPAKFFFRFREPIGFQVQVISNTGGTVTGTVTLFEGQTALGTATLDGAGRATVLVNGLRVGEHEIRAIYSGDSNFPDGAESPVVTYSRSPKPR